MTVLKKRNYISKLEPMNLEEEFKKDMKSGKGFIIKEPASAKTGVKNKDSIYSREYGSLWGDKDPFMERYSCEKGCMQGKFNLGEICPKCGTEVVFVDTDLEITGWVIIDKYKIIAPVFYNYLESLIGRRPFKQMIHFNRKIDVKGDFEDITIDYTKKHPFKGIGLHLFHEYFDDIIEYYVEQRKNKRKYYDAIQKHRDKVFTNYVPVYSLLLRPAIVEGDNNYFYSKVNGTYTTLVNMILKINEGSELETYRSIIKIYPALEKVQEKFMEVYDHVLDKLFGKSGNYRNKTLGARFNFTGRAVIRPASSGLKIDEIEVSYLTFLELYKMEIINLLTKFNNYSIKKAELQFFTATRKFDEEIYNIMMHLINRGEGEYIKINRNPSLHYNSLLLMKIARITKNVHNKSMGVPIQILRFIGGDFDGDVLNQGSIKDLEVMLAFKEKFNPRENIMIDRNTGLFNYDMGLARDQMVSISHINRV